MRVLAVVVSAGIVATMAANARTPHRATDGGAAIRSHHVTESDTIPPVIGMRVDDARRKLAESGYRNVSVKGRGDFVLAQTPRVGEHGRPAVAITLIT